MKQPDSARGVILKDATRPERTAADLIAERDDAALRYFLRRTVIKYAPGEKMQPRVCPYCGSAGIVLSKRIGDQRVLMSKLQEVGEGKEILCLSCHRCFKITLLGWE